MQYPPNSDNQPPFQPWQNNNPQSSQPLYPGQFRKNKNVQIGIAIACVFLLLSLITFTSFAAMADRMHALARLTPTVTPQQAVLNVDTMSNMPEVANIAISVLTQQSTPTLRPKLSPAPILRSIVKPTPKATQPSLKLSITFTCASAVDYSYGHVCVHVQPGAALTITVTYCSGYTAKSASLQGTFYADSGGNYTWSWKPETKCRGKATADVNASWNRQKTSSSDNFIVK